MSDCEVLKNNSQLVSLLNWRRMVPVKCVKKETGCKLDSRVTTPLRELRSPSWPLCSKDSGYIAVYCEKNMLFQSAEFLNNTAASTYLTNKITAKHNYMFGVILTVHRR